jgi:signal transduction histidine kinase
MATPLRLLILEDNPSDAALMLHALRAAGYDPIPQRVDTETDFRRHLEVPPDIVLSDFSMPGFDALRALDIMREVQLNIPMIIVSVTIGEERAVQIMQRGAADYIVKDRLGRLGQAVTQALEQRRLRISERQAELALRESEVLSRRVQEAQLRDQEARKQAEHDNQVKDEFFATLSHELRTPLTSMLGWCRLLLTGDLDEETRRKGLTVIDRNVKLQCKLVEEILDISRIITGKLLLDIISLDVNRVVDAAIEVTKPIAEKKKIQIEHSFSDHPVMIAGDPHRLEQVFSNLLTNAIKFTPSGGQIRIAVIESATEVDITIADSGIGISPEFLPQVFDRYSQANSSCIRDHGGLGIGLSLVKHLSELHGGHVRVESSGEGLGACFTVSLPISRKLVAKTSHIQPALERRGQVTPLYGAKLLICDDEPDILELLACVFQREGALVMTANSVRESVSRYKNAKPDIILSGFGLPFNDGCSLIREIRILELNSGAFTPAIALNALARDEDRARSLQAGFQTHIPKPIDPVELVAAVAELLEKKPGAVGS